MRVQPNSGELFWPAPTVDLRIEEIGNRLVVEGNMHAVAILFDELHVFDEQQIIARRNSETADFRFAVVTQENEF